jgi:Flp pilus assembly protein TadD
VNISKTYCGQLYTAAMAPYIVRLFGGSLFLSVLISAHAQITTPSDAELRQGQKMYMDGDLAGALSTYRHVALSRPNDPNVRFLIAQPLGNAYGLVLLAQEKSSDAPTQFQEALSLNPAMEDAKVNHAIALNQGGRSSEAEPEFRTVLQTNPRNLKAQAGLAVLVRSEAIC